VFLFKSLPQWNTSVGLGYAFSQSR
jgi:hypothetical protein